jgi:hypothetical protein
MRKRRRLIVIIQNTIEKYFMYCEVVTSVFILMKKKHARPIRVMAKNLHYSCKPENIMKSLSDDGFITIMADNKLSWKEKLPLNMFMLTFGNSEDIDKIYKVTHILGCKVEIQPIRG